MIEDKLAAYPSQIIQRTTYINEYDLYLHGEIGDPDGMMEHYNLYRQATENDIIRLWIISPGGSSATASQYFQHMRECKATILGIPGHENASAATAIAMHCDNLQIGPFTTFMIHGVSYGYYGTANRMALESDALLKFNKKFMELVYDNFLSPTEIQHCLEGNDLLFDADEIQERWDRFKEVRDSLTEYQFEEGTQTEASLEEFDFDDMIASAVEKGIDKAMAKVYKKYDLTVKIPVKKVKSPSPDLSLFNDVVGEVLK